MQEPLSNQGENDIWQYSSLLKPRAPPWEHPKGALGAARRCPGPMGRTG